MGAHVVGVALVALSGAAFGAMAIFAKLAYADGADPLTVLGLRFALASVSMLAIMRARGDRLPRGRTLLALIALGGIGYVSQSLAYFTALTMASAALVALLLDVYPAMVAVAAALLFGDRITPVKAVALVVALAGTALTIGDVGGGRPLGIVLGLVAAVAYATYILLSSRLVPRAGAIPAASVVMLAAAGVLGVVMFLSGPSFPRSATGWAAIAGLALISTVVAIVAFFAGLERIRPAEASTISTVEPVVTVALAALVLHESLSTVQLIGGTLIVSAVVVLARAGRPQLVPAEAPPT